MQFPFRIIESSISKRSQFDVTDGCQPTHALFYLKKGSFDIEIDGTGETVRSGDCLILPDYLHFRRNITEPIEFVYIKFTDNLRCPYSLSIPYGKVAFDDKKRFSYNITIIEQLLDCDDALSINYLEHLLHDILFQISFSQENFGLRSEQHLFCNELIASATAYISEHICNKILIKDICHAVGSNSSTLNFSFRREFDMSVGQYIMNERMKKAKRFLIGTTYSIAEIAKRCGFDNIYYFSNAFKKKYGVSPTEYRSDYA